MLKEHHDWNGGNKIEGVVECQSQIGLCVCWWFSFPFVSLNSENRKEGEREWKGERERGEGESSEHIFGDQFLRDELISERNEMVI